MGRSAVLCLLPLMLTAALPAVAEPAGPSGYYRIPQGGQGGAMIVAISACGTDRYCGRLVDFGSLPAKDTRNPSLAGQDRALCGLEILSATDDAGNTPQPHQFRGTFYDPRSGDENAVSLWIGDGGELRVSGHAGRPILSRSYVRPQEVWQPVPQPQLACDGTRPVS